MKKIYKWILGGVLLSLVLPSIGLAIDLVIGEGTYLNLKIGSSITMFSGCVLGAIRGLAYLLIWLLND